MHKSYKLSFQSFIYDILILNFSFHWICLDRSEISLFSILITENYKRKI